MNDHRGFAGDLIGLWMEQHDGGYHFIADRSNLRKRSEEQIVAYFKQIEPGASGITICAAHDVSEPASASLPA